MASKSIHAQNAVAKIDSLIIGTWHGSSLCQIKNSPCHDETVIYHISNKKGTDSFFINASKIINGAEEEMGILPIVYNKKTNQLTSSAYGNWTFYVKGDTMEGTLFYKGELYRKIKLSRRK